MMTIRRLGLLLLLIACAPLTMALSGGPRGHAFEDLNNNGVQDPGEPGLVGWVIRLFDPATKQLRQSVVTEANSSGLPPTGDGFYSFNLGPGTYTLCVTPKEGWTQTAPLFVPPPPEATLADCTSYADGGAGELAARGYTFTMKSSEVHDHLDFGLTFGSERISLDDVQLWLGLKSSDDQGTQFDVKVELLKNGYPVASGLRRCVTGLTRNPTLAKGVRVAWDDSHPVAFALADELALKISTRIGTNPDDTKCVPRPASAHTSARGLRLYYDAASRPAAFDVTVAPGSNHSLYLDSNGTACPAGGSESAHVTDRTLTGTDPTALAAKCQDSSSIRFTGGNVFSEVGTWIRP
jgi:hypothetical protein